MTKTEAIAELRNICTPGRTVYTILRHVSRSGMQRCISVCVTDDDGIHQLDYLMHIAGIAKRSTRHEGLVCTGCGMDMGFGLVYAMGERLYPNGTPEPHGTRNGEPDSSGGYALKHRWM